MSSSPPIIIILGPPGSGKGTQAVRLTSHCNLEHLSPGALLRELQSGDQTKLSLQVQEELHKVDKGEMVSHWLVYDIMFPKILHALKKGEGVIIDGAIRTREQVDGYIDFFKKYNLIEDVTVIWIRVQKARAMARLARRKTKENGVVIRRHDDINKRALQNRFAVQGTRAQKPVLTALARHVRVVAIDGNGSIDDTERILGETLVKEGIMRKKEHTFICETWSE